MASKVPVPNDEEIERFRKLVPDDLGIGLTPEEAAEWAAKTVTLVYAMDAAKLEQRSDEYGTPAAEST